MIFGQIAAGSSILVDSVTFVHYFQPHPVHGPACQQLIQRIEQQQITGFTTTQVLGEVAHRLMTLEARTLQGWSSGKVIQRLKQHPSVIQNLSQFETAVDDILQSQVQVLTVLPAHFIQATRLSRQHGL
jgi:predicted nucleic acid-binding protein